MKTNRKKSFSYLLFFLLLLVFLALFAFLGIRSFYRANYMPEPCTESADELSNPYIDFITCMAMFLEAIRSRIFLPPLILTPKTGRELSCWK